MPALVLSCCGGSDVELDKSDSVSRRFLAEASVDGRDSAAGLASGARVGIATLSVGSVTTPCQAHHDVARGV
jgi:hypothetical protein